MFSYITRPIRILWAWRAYDNEITGAKGIELDRRNVELGLLLLDLKTRKTLANDVTALNRRLTKEAQIGEFSQRDFGNSKVCRS